MGTVRSGRRVSVLAATLLAIALLAPSAVAKNETSVLAESRALRNQVTLKGVRAHQQAWQQIADDNGGHRFAGTPGSEESGEYVFNKLEAAGLSPWYQSFEYPAFIETSVSVLRQIAPTAATYVNGNDFRVMTYSGSGDTTAPLAAPSGDFRGCNESDFAGFPAGSIAIVSRGAPAGFPVACTFRLKTDNATAAGASAVLIYNNIPGLLNGTLGAESGLASIPSLGLTQALGQSLTSQMASGTVTMHVVTDTDAETLTTRNVFAEITGQTNDVIVVGAHLDSVNAGPGINDNGSGSAAILEVARAMSRLEKYDNPTNTVRFAWWSAEESGLVGSRFYVNDLSAAELARIKLNLNFDMIGSPNYVRFRYDGDNSTFPAGVDGVQTGPAGSGEIEQVFVSYFDSNGLASAPTPFNGRSDYGPFIERGIPAGGLFTGAEGIKTAAQAAVYGGTAGTAFDPCYHAACDTFANNNNTVLDQNSDAVAHATHTYAVRDFTADPLIDPAPLVESGAGGGGGLHDDHEVVDH